MNTEHTPSSTDIQHQSTTPQREDSSAQESVQLGEPLHPVTMDIQSAQPGTPMNKTARLVIECGSETEIDNAPTAFVVNITQALQQRIADLSAACVAQDMAECAVQVEFDVLTSSSMYAHMDLNTTNGIANHAYVRLPACVLIPPDAFTVVAGHRLIVTPYGWRLRCYDRFSGALFLSNAISHKHTDVFDAPPAIASAAPQFTACAA